MILPESLSSQAFRASNGELAWRREQLSEIVAEYTRQGHAVEALEVWLVDDSGRWTGLIPTVNTDVPSVCVYDVKGRAETEDRGAFVARCAREILDKIGEWNIEGEVQEPLRPRIRYTLYVADEYAEPPAAADGEDAAADPQRWHGQDHE